MHEGRMSIYARLGIRTVVNARGNATLAGGTLMHPDVVDAMGEAARSFVRIGDLQDAASRQIAELTGAEAGYVTTGAAAALTLGAAAMLARLDPDRMDRLPDTEGAPSEIVVGRTHRNPYDHLVRAAGARLIEFGDDDGAATAAMADRIGPATAGAFFHGQAEATGLPLVDFVEIAHAHGLPVLVDASMSLPPRANLRRYIDAGVDLVAFSGGKTIGGPQASGFLAGRRELLVSVGLQQQDMDVLPATWARRSLLESGTLTRPPTHGIGRSMKTGKEEIVGLLTALRRYATHDESEERRRWETLTSRLAASLSDVPGLLAWTEPAQADGRPVPATVVRVDGNVYGRTAVDLVRAFEAQDPIIMLADHESEAGILRLDPENLDDDAVATIVEAFRRCARPAGGSDVQTSS
jgi:D-glucosaminate-6-phosphate ammonia-lyase